MKKVVLNINPLPNMNDGNQLEKKLRKNKKIKSVMVNISNSTITVICKKNLAIDEIEKEIDILGYQSLGVELICSTQKPSMLPFFILGFFFLIAFYFSLASIFHLPLEHLFSNRIKRIGITTLTSIFLIYGIDIIWDGVKNFFKGSSNINTLATISILSSTSYGLYTMFSNTNQSKNNMYLLIAMTFIYVLKIGLYLEKKNKRRIESEISQISKTKLDKVNRKKEDAYEEVNISEVKIGDQILCLPGDKILLDGIISKNASHFDETLVNGRSTPILKNKADKLLSGSINYENEIEYSVDANLKDTYTSQIKKMIVEEKNRKKQRVNTINQFCRYWIPILLLVDIAIGVLYYITTKNMEESLWKVLELLIVSCPLGFLVITPLSSNKNNKVAIKKKLWIKKMDTLEQMKKIDTIVFDKTGTLTTGYLSINKIHNHSDLEDKKLLELLGSIEKHSTDALARGITKYLRGEKITATFDFVTEDLPGYGVKAKDDNDLYYACNNALLKKLEIENLYQEEERKLSIEGNSTIYLVKNNKIIATFGLSDICKKESSKVISSLQERKLNVMILTGDNEKVGNKIAKELGVSNVICNLDPSQKKEYIKNLLKEKHKVLMIGDGINDAPSLATATIGIALKKNSDIPTAAADMILDSSHIFKIIDLFTMSSILKRMVKRNIFLSWIIWLVEFILVLDIIPKIHMNSLFLLILMFINLIIVVLNIMRVKNK